MSVINAAPRFRSTKSTRSPAAVNGEPRMIDKLKDIPANPNSIAIGLSDPQPEKGKEGSTWRALVSWLKGWSTK